MITKLTQKSIQCTAHVLITEYINNRFRRTIDMIGFIEKLRVTLETVESLLVCMLQKVSLPIIPWKWVILVAYDTSASNKSSAVFESTTIRVQLLQICSAMRLTRACWKENITVFIIQFLEWIFSKMFFTRKFSGSSVFVPILSTNFLLHKILWGFFWSPQFLWRFSLIEKCLFWSIFCNHKWNVHVFFHLIFFLFLAWNILKYLP